MLAGGPGQSALESLPVGASRRLRRAAQEAPRDPGRPARHRRSNTLVCKDAEGQSAVVERGGLQPGAARSLRRALRGHAGARPPTCASTRPATRSRTSTRCARRSAPSRSTWWASPTARASRSSTRARYPTHTRTVTLDGIVPNTLVLGSEHARNLERSLDRQFERCAAGRRPASSKLGDPRAQPQRAAGAARGRAADGAPTATRSPASSARTKLTPGHARHAGAACSPTRRRPPACCRWNCTRPRRAGSSR